MNTPPPNDPHTALRQALQRDAGHLPEPPFDAALHAATMRRIRALPDPGPVRYGWPLACTGLAAAAVLAFMGWTAPAWQSRRPSERPGAAQTHSRATSTGTPPAHGAAFDPGSFADQRLRYAMLDAGAGARPAAGFPLDIPTGPMRLDCAYTPHGDGPAHSLFGRFNFNFSN